MRTYPVYATFGYRLGAYYLDGVILLPLALSTLIACRFMPALVLASFITIKNVVHFLYRPVCHKLWGKTLGKKVCRLEVTAQDGSPLSWGRAFIRELFFIPEHVFSLLAIWLAMRAAPPFESFIDFQATMKAFYQQMPRTGMAIYYVFAMLMPLVQAAFVWKHPRHRALHDVVAGTVVLRRPRVRETGAAAEPIKCFLCKVTIPPDIDRCPVCGWTFRE